MINKLLLLYFTWRLNNVRDEHDACEQVLSAGYIDSDIEEELVYLHWEEVILSLRVFNMERGVSPWSR